MSNVLVTGGARGIGSGIVRELAARGHNVGFSGRADASSCADFLAELHSLLFIALIVIPPNITI